MARQIVLDYQEATTEIHRLVYSRHAQFVGLERIRRFLLSSATATVKNPNKIEKRMPLNLCSEW